MSTFTSDLSGTEFDESEKLSAKTIRRSLMKLIREDHPDFSEDQFLAESELSYYRDKYMVQALTAELSKQEQIDGALIHRLTNMVSEPVATPAEEHARLSFGQRVADNVAEFGGSWTFIISFGLFIALWIGSNVYLLANKGFDPYPFILLNLILSCIAALQAPIIMMSQNRQEEKDRERAKEDYLINLKSELEIRVLHEKIDHLILRQQKELFEIQKMQLKIMEDLLASKKP